MWGDLTDVSARSKILIADNASYSDGVITKKNSDLTKPTCLELNLFCSAH